MILSITLSNSTNWIWKIIEAVNWKLCCDMIALSAFLTTKKSYFCFHKKWRKCRSQVTRVFLKAFTSAWLICNSKDTKSHCLTSNWSSDFMWKFLPNWQVFDLYNLENYSCRTVKRILNFYSSLLSKSRPSHNLALCLLENFLFLEKVINSILSNSILHMFVGNDVQYLSPKCWKYFWNFLLITFYLHLCMFGFIW